MSTPVGPRPLVLCGPSGSGKSTLLKMLLDDYSEKCGFTISHTTRAPRPGEIDGVDYHFMERDNMQALINEGAFIETNEFSGNIYGTSKQAVKDVMGQGKICILDIDVNGVKTLKASDELNPRYIFIKPPSLEELEKRLRDRGTETEESLEMRLSSASAELEYAEEGNNFDIVIINEDKDQAYEELKEFVLQDITEDE